MSEVESHSESLEKSVNDQTMEQQSGIEKDLSTGSKIIHLGTKYTLVRNLVRQLPS